MHGRCVYCKGVIPPGHVLCSVCGHPVLPPGPSHTGPSIKTELIFAAFTLLVMLGVVAFLL